jgi:hypothetical protein
MSCKGRHDKGITGFRGGTIPTVSRHTCYKVIKFVEVQFLRFHTVRGGGGVTKQDPGRDNSLVSKKRGGVVFSHQYSVIMLKPIRENSDSITDGGVAHPDSYGPDTVETLPVWIEVVPICTVYSRERTPMPRIPST